MINLSFDFNLFNNYYYFYERLIVILFSLVPSLILTFFVLYSDRKSKEPAKNILLCLLSGILTISLANYFEGLVMPYFSNNFLLTYIWAFIEELSKMSIFFLFIFDNKYYDDIYDGVVYMMLIALSFAGLENIMYSFSENTISNSISLSLMRDFTTVPLHVICGIIIGYFMSLASFSKQKNKKYMNILLAILISSFIHGTFNNLMVMLDSVSVSSNIQIVLFKTIPLFIIMIVLFVIAIKYVKKSNSLNEVFIKNDKYDKKHDYLMNKDEYIDSNYRKQRIKRYEKISFNKFERKKFND